MNFDLLNSAAALCLFFKLFFLGQVGTTTPVPAADAAAVREEIQQVADLLPKLPDRGAALFLIAHDYAHLGDADKALSFLRDCIFLDEGFNPEGDPAFALLKTDAEFKSLVDRVHRRYPPVEKARVAFTVPEKTLIPEGLAIDKQSRTLYMGSLNLRKIVTISRNGDVSDFVKEGQYDIRPICGLKVQASDHTVWANSCPDDGRGAELLHFDVAGKLIERFPAPGTGQHLFNDLVLRGEQEVYLTDSLANRIYKFDRKSHSFIESPLCRPVYYPNGIALSEDGNMLYVADAFGIVQLELRNQSCHEVIPGPSNTVSGADGLYWYRNSLIAVQNSLGFPRIAQFHLSPDGTKVKTTTILEYGSPLLTSPTTGAILGSRFYFMSNTQIDNYKSEKIMDASKLEPVRISILILQD
ncbi:MAG: hypothetical protein JO249_22425 [Acidobacteria bacterium]|nr:hypothetical protein [Acidobacteriota bacterium]